MCKFVNNTKHSRIDKCMKELVLYLKNANIPVLACCCGHSKYPKTIVVRLHIGCGEPTQLELLSWIRIPRTRNFYKKDKQGIYFIPEVCSSN